MRTNQRKHDLDRESFDLIYPTNLREDRPTAFLNAVGHGYSGNIARFGGISTLVFETIASDRGISHRIRVPASDTEYLLGQLEGHIDGTDVTPTPDEDDAEFIFGVRLYMTEPLKPLVISNSQDHSTKILKSIQTDHQDERVVLQWIIAHSDLKKEEVKQNRPGFAQALLYGNKTREHRPPAKASRPAEQTFVAVGRVAAYAEDERRGKQLVMKVVRALQSENSGNHIYAVPMRQSSIAPEMNEATTPIRNKGNLFTVSELVSMVGWPIGDPQIPGLRQGSARRFPATEAIAREGWIFGHSDVHGRNRPIALADGHAPKHTIIVGAPGSGKSVFMSNGAVQYAEAGYGVIVIDAGTDVSPQRLYYRALDSMPANRIDDIICVNPADDQETAVSINLLDQGFGLGIIDQIVGVFSQLYPSIKEGVSVRELLHHGLWTLIEHGGYTLIDLASLLSPRNPQERMWAHELIKGVKDPELKDFWDRNPGATTKAGTRERERWNQYVEPLHRRLWQLAGRPEIRNIIGQTKSSIYIRDVLAENKILLVSLGGMPEESAELFSTLLTNLIWQSAQQTKVDRMNVLMIDEFQIASQVQGGLSDVLARARAHKLGLILGTQFITRGNINRELQGTVVNNTGTKVIFKSGAQEAALWARELGGRSVQETDITKLHAFHGMAQIANDMGDSTPVTFKALMPPHPTGVAKEVMAMNRYYYGTSVEDIRQEIAERRKSSKRNEEEDDGPIGRSAYDPEEE